MTIMQTVPIIATLLHPGSTPSTSHVSLQLSCGNHLQRGTKQIPHEAHVCTARAVFPLPAVLVAVYAAEDLDLVVEHTHGPCVSVYALVQRVSHAPPPWRPPTCCTRCEVHGLPSPSLSQPPPAHEIRSRAVSCVQMMALKRPVP